MALFAHIRTHIRIPQILNSHVHLHIFLLIYGFFVTFYYAKFLAYFNGSEKNGLKATIGPLPGFSSKIGKDHPFWIGLTLRFSSKLDKNNQNVMNFN